MIYSDFLPLIEADFLAVLQSDPVFGRRPGFAAEPGTPQTALEGRLTTAAAGAGADGKCGVAWMTLPIEDVEWPDADVALDALKLPLEMDILENVVINRGPRGTRQSIRVYATYIAKVLSNYAAALLTSAYVPDKAVIKFYTPVVNGKVDEALRGARVNFYGYEQDPICFPQCGCPQILLAGAAATITCPGAAALYYTIDGSHPWAKNPAAVAVASGAVVNLAAGRMLRARGFLAAGTGGSPTAAVYLQP